MRGLLGGKGANLAEMTRLGIPVPPGFTITTDACRAYLASGTYTADILPLHVCAVATFAVFVDALRPNRWTGDFLYAMGWWGGLAADPAVAAATIAGVLASLTGPDAASPGQPV